MHSLTALGYTFCVKTALILYIYPRALLFENAPASLSLAARRKVGEQCAKVAILFLGPNDLCFWPRARERRKGGGLT